MHFKILAAVGAQLILGIKQGPEMDFYLPGQVPEQKSPQFVSNSSSAKSNPKKTPIKKTLTQSEFIWMGYNKEEPRMQKITNPNQTCFKLEGDYYKENNCSCKKCSGNS